MGRFFEPTELPGLADAQLDSPIVDVQCGGYHLALLTQSGKMYTCGTGPSLALARVDRQQWTLCPVVHFGDERKVLSIACGPYTT